MNILMLTPTYPPTQGGVQTQVKLLAEELNRREHKISVITEEVENAPEMEEENSIEIFRLKDPFRLKDANFKFDPWRSYFFIKQNIDEIEKIVREEKADILHVHHADMSFAYAYLLKKYFDIPIVSTIHVSWLADPIYRRWRLDIKEPIRRTFRLLPGLWFDKKSILSSDFVITISKQFERICERIRGDGKVATIPNAIDLNQFNPDVRPTEFNCRGYKILCPARISPEKGQIYLIDALKTVNESTNAHVFFMGSGNPKEEKKLKNRVCELGLEKYVHFLIPQPYDMVPGFYKAADLIALPSTSESSGLVIIENMALGNVVVASNVGGIPELIEHEETGLLTPPGESKPLAETIIRALEDEELREKIRINAVKKAKNYGVEKNVEKIELIYQKVTN